MGGIQGITLCLPMQDVFPWGDETFTIKRGVDVSIPYYVWLHLQECQQADDALTLRMNDLSGSFTSSVELYKL